MAAAMNPAQPQYTREDVTRLCNVIDACDLLEANGIEYGNLELEGLKQLLLQHLDMSAADEPQQSAISRDLFERHEVILEKLSRICEDMIDRVMYENLREMVTEFNPLYQLTRLGSTVGSLVDYLNMCRAQIMDTECPIIVTGNVSAGKSGLINMLINDEIMPVFNNHMTSAVCILHSSQEKKIRILKTVTDSDGVERQEEIVERFEENSSAKVMQEALNNKMREILITEGDDIQIHTYWPVARLPPNIPIIDTPAMNLTKKITEVSQAVAFICIFNAALSESNHLEHSQIDEYFTTFSMSTVLELTQKPPLFVLNKWDTIPEHEQTIYRDRARNKLDSHVRNIYNIPSDEDWTRKHVFELSVNEVLEQQRSNIHDENIRSFDYQDFMSSFTSLLSDVYKYKAAKYQSILSRIAEDINSSLVDKIRLAKSSSIERKKIIERDKQVIEKLEYGTNVLISELKEIVESYSYEILNRLDKCIHSTDAVNLLEDLCQKNSPKTGGLDIIEVSAAEKIDSLIKSLLIEEKRKLFNQINAVIENKVETVYNAMMKDTGVVVDDALTSVDRHTVPTIPEPDPLWNAHAVLFVVFLPVYFPVLVTAGLIGAPILVAKSISEHVKQMVSLSEYHKNRPKYMKDWLRIRLSTIWNREALVDMHIVDKFKKDLLEQKVSILENERIPGTLTMLKMQTANKEKSTETSDEAVRRYSGPHRTFQRMLGQLRLFRLQHLSRDPNYIPFNRLNIDYRNILGSGSYGCVYAGTMITTLSKAPVPIATKVMNHASEENSMCLYLHLCELDILSKLRHNNIVRLHGVSLEEFHTPEFNRLPSIHLVMERCHRYNLQRHIFANPLRIPGKHEAGSDGRTQAVREYVRTAMQICRGLAYLHCTAKHVHGDLTLCNVLVSENGVVKIGDFGFCVTQTLISGTVRGTPTHMAPEVMEQDIYCTTADIYSLSIMFWEMWYGRQYEPSSTSLELVNAVKNGLRPSIHDRHLPQRSLRDLLMQMWDGNEQNRPDIIMVIQVIRDLELTQ